MASPQPGCLGIEIGASCFNFNRRPQVKVLIYMAYANYYLPLTAHSCCGPYMIHIQCAAKSMNNWLAPWVLVCWFLFLILV